MSASDVIRRIVEALGRANVPYMLTGSFASAAHGEPRGTYDIDIVIAPTREQLAALMDQFPRGKYGADREDAFDALASRGMFNVIDYATQWKVDFIVRKDWEFSVTEFGRRRQVDLAGTTVDVAAPEDVILSKLEWAKMGESERQLDDVAGIIRSQRHALDLPYIERWVVELELLHQWAKASLKAR